MSRLEVRKTYKLYIGGAFPRSESGRTYEAHDAKGRFLANAAKASRKDARDAVLAARKAFGGWSTRTPYNRGQILYRVAEVAEGRREQFVEHLRAGGTTQRKAEAQVDAAIDRFVWYAGWADKITQVIGNANPVSSPHFNLSTPEPTGVVAIVAPTDALLGLVSVVAPVIATGNTCVVLASEASPLPAITLSEVMATSDLPGGVVNMLTGNAAEVSPCLADHMDVNGIDLAGIDTGSDNGATLAADLETRAAENLKRVRRPDGGAPDWAAEPGLDRLQTFLETKTVWHPIGV